VVWLVAGAVASPGQETPSAPAATPAVRLAELPERFFQIQDEAGFFWQALDNGALISGDTQYLQSCLNLIVDGEPFAPSSGQVREPGTGGERIDVRLEEARPSYAISRDLWFDTARSGVRVFDLIRNTGNAELKLPVVLRTTYPFAWQSLHGTGGRVLGTEATLRLDPADVSLGVHFSPSDGRHDTFFLLGSEKGGQRPEVKASANSRELVFLYTISIPPGESRSLLHWVLQRNLPEVSQDTVALTPFLQRGQLVAPGVESKLAESLVNFVPAAFVPETTIPAKLNALVPLNELSANLGLYRRSEDVLRIGPTAQVPGALVREGSLTIAVAPLGEVTVKVADLAAVRGGGGQGRVPRFFLRDGRVCAGLPTAGTLLWKERGAEPKPLDPAAFHLLLLATEGRDGSAPEGATHLVELSGGSVLAVHSKEASVTDWVTPWGRERLAWSDLREAVRERTPRAHFRLMTRDGSFLVALPDPKLVALDLAEGKAIEIPPASIERIWTTGRALDTPEPGARDWLDFSEIPPGLGPVTGVLLSGDQWIAGELEPGTLSLRDGASIVGIEAGTITALRRSTDPDSRQTLTIETAGGERFSGAVVDSFLRLKRPGGTVVEIPLEALLAYRKGGARG
jgi:hypothetical protein